MIKSALCVYVCVFVQVLKKISRYIQEQNEKVYAPRGLLITDPIERGMRVVSLQSVCVCAHEQKLLELQKLLLVQLRMSHKLFYYLFIV